MCGLAGIFDTRGNRSVDLSLLKQMNQALFHRGPDGDGIHFGAGIGLTHRRLAIIDLVSGMQPLYNDDKSMDELALAQSNDVVLVPSGYHPVAAAPGYNVYYLNFLVGSDQLLTATNDPDHEWVYNSWQGLDPRVPVVTLEMNNQD